MKTKLAFVALMALAAGASAKAPPPVTLEPIPGSSAKRVILTAKAAERLGIETGRVSQAPIVRKQMVGGLVIPAPGAEPKPDNAPNVASGANFASFATPSNKLAIQPVVAQPASAGATSPIESDAWVLVTLTLAEWTRLAKDKPARLLPLTTRAALPGEVLAQPSGLPPREDTKRSMLTVVYKVPGKAHGLALNKRVRVELELAGNEEVKTVVPYSAVYYDAKGAPWVYRNPAPLVFERHRIGIERIAGDLAVLKEGPPVGTAVVTVGASLLYGAEIFGK